MIPAKFHFGNELVNRVRWRYNEAIVIRTLPVGLAAATIAWAGSALGQSVSVEAVPESVVNRPFPALRNGRPSDIEWRSLRFHAANIGTFSMS